MNVKSYFAATVEAALSQAARELGPEAMLIYTRETPVETRNQGRYEVVFGWEQVGGATLTEVADEPRGPARVRPRVREDHFVPAADKPEPIQPHEGPSPESYLLAEGFSPLLAQELSAALPEGATDLTGAAWAKCLAARVPLAGQGDGLKATAIAFAGPPGSGKTAAAARLAFQQGAARGRRVHLVSTDTDRVCGGARLRRYAELMGAIHSEAATLTALEGILRSEPPGRLLIIDGGGWLPLAGSAWSAFRRRNQFQLHLLLPVAFRPRDAARVFARYRALQPDRLVAARTDESTQVGAVCSLARETGIPLSFVTSGDSIADGLERATAAQLVRVLKPGLTASTPAGSIETAQPVLLARAAAAEGAEPHALLSRQRV
jgi:flagellar biosynthesis protein FlhF